MLKIHTVFLAFALLASVRTARAQQCLHGNDETAGEHQRRMDAVNAVRTLNTAEAMHKSTTQKYASFTELIASRAWVIANRSGTLPSGPGTELIPGFVLHLTTDGSAYSVALKDRNDPCGFSVYSNELGVIFTGYPIDYKVVPSK